MPCSVGTGVCETSDGNLVGDLVSMSQDLAAPRALPLRAIFMDFLALLLLLCVVEWVILGVSPYKFTRFIVYV